MLAPALSVPMIPYNTERTIKPRYEETNINKHLLSAYMVPASFGLIPYYHIFSNVPIRITSMSPNMKWTHSNISMNDLFSHTEMYILVFGPGELLLNL